MSEILDQATLNLRYAQAQERRMNRLEKENVQLREIVEAMRVHLLNLTKGGKDNEPRNTDVGVP